jgi:hypothetical protein
VFLSLILSFLLLPCLDHSPQGFTLPYCSVRLQAVLACVTSCLDAAEKNMDFESLKKREREGWMAMRFGCCASKDEVEDSREELKANGMLQVYFHSHHRHIVLAIVNLAVPYFLFVTFILFKLCVRSGLQHTVELPSLASALLNPVNLVYQRQHNLPLNNPTGSISYLTILMANDLQQGPRICRLSMSSHRLCRNPAPNPSTLVHPPASPLVVMSLNG